MPQFPKLSFLTIASSSSVWATIAFLSARIGRKDPSASSPSRAGPPPGLALAGLFCLSRYYTGLYQQIKTAKRRHCLKLVLSPDGAPDRPIPQLFVFTHNDGRQVQKLFVTLH